MTYKHYKFTPVEERNGTSVFVINFISSMRNKQINKIDNLIEIKKIFNTTESREKSKITKTNSSTLLLFNLSQLLKQWNTAKKKPVNIESSIALIKKWF